jgi:ribosomal-protein-alanine N-acetyltransferase
MCAADLDRAMEIAAGLRDAPHWPRAAYAAALNPESAPLRIALVAEETAKSTGQNLSASDETESGRVVGFLIAVVVEPEAELESIAVARQRRGTGRRLMQALVEQLEQAGVTRIFLEVRASNQAARGLYQALGFSETGRRRAYYADPVEDAVLMSRPVR